MTSHITTTEKRTIERDDPFARLVADALSRLRSPRSQRVYGDTYKQWREWCEAREINPHELTTDYVELFLRSGNRSQASINRMLASMRTLAAAAVLRYPQYPQFENLHARLKLLKVHVEDTEDRRPRKALRGDEVYKAVNVWNEDRLLHRRNRALVALLFYTGLRRAEAAALQWEDLDLREGLVYVARGKGQKERTVPILGQMAIDALDELRVDLYGHKYAFPSMRRGDHPTPRPITGHVVYQVIQRTSILSGVEFRPHDARRTVLTGIIANGGSVRDAQAVAGHTNAATTMRYAQAEDAKDLRKKLKTGY